MSIKLLTEEKAIHSQWTEYCIELYSYKLRTDAIISKNVNKIENRQIGEAPILKEEE